ncbi:uncharacterized protein LOC127663100 isoform X2 [Xyrauchen texanus]|uniref:uncharacterized protein LOC127663100 isoform X2 n=1 Tax=Xyrauchen texanus TaxID=154827 RepID=UPI002241B5B7|nr:uncharacterized protein LOC127663100 isoform X2 [Xyrauchen texanus]
MYTWRCFIAMSFVMVWYFSGFGQLWTQALFCFLCFFRFPFKNQDRETSTQTDNITEETSRQTKKCHHVGDELDATRIAQIRPQTMQYPNVQRSLLQVFKCAYAHLVQPWYTVPELGDSQPLHMALQREFNMVVEKTICKAKKFDLSATSVGCIRILTQHLHRAKQSDGSPVFSSRSEEMAVLRTFSVALVRNLFPEYLWEPHLYQCVITEILATKALDVLVTCLCNPDSLNQMVVLQLDRVTPKNSIGDLVNSDREGTPSSTGSERAEVMTDTEDGWSEETRGKKKGNRIKETFSTFVNKLKSKKAKRKKLKNKEQELLQRALSARRSAVIENDDASTREGSIRSCMDSDNDSDVDVFLTSLQEDMMEFKLSYEMWRVGMWAVRVTNVEKEKKELCFTIHLEERDNPENLHWDVKKTQSDILHFHSLWQDTSTLPSVSAVVEKTKRELDETYTEEVRSALEHLLQELISDTQLGHTRPVFQFLCPLEKLLSEEEDEGGVWGLLSGLACFLTPEHDEEETHNPKVEEKVYEAGSTVHHGAQPACFDMVEEPDSGIVDEPMSTNFRFSTPNGETDPFRSEDPDMEDNNQIFNEAKEVSDGLESIAESLDIFVNRSKILTPTIQSNDGSSSVMSHNEVLQLAYKADRVKSLQSGGKTNKKEKLTKKKSSGSQKLIFKGKEKMGQLKEDPTNQPQVQEKESSQTNWEQIEATKAIFDLLKEITGNSVFINIVDAVLKPVMPLVKKKINNFLKSMNPTEAQIASYIDILREKMWPIGDVPLQPPRDSEEKHETKERALQLINSKYSNSLILKKTDVETVFKIFQDTEENKKLVYMLLSYVLREFLPGEPAFTTIDNLTENDFVS